MAYKKQRQEQTFPAPSRLAHKASADAGSALLFAIMSEYKRP
jgi:hypothetical protein